MIPEVKNHGVGRVRKDLVHNWFAALLQHEPDHDEPHPSGVEGVDPISDFACPRCGHARGPREGLADHWALAFVNLNGSPLQFDALMDESSNGLQRRHICQCLGCNLIVAESYFCPGPDKYPADMLVRLHLIQPEE